MGLVAVHCTRGITHFDRITGPIFENIESVAYAERVSRQPSPEPGDVVALDRIIEPALSVSLFASEAKAFWRFGEQGLMRCRAVGRELLV
jgi:hypothetical protein